MKGPIKIEKIAIMVLISLFCIYALFESLKLIQGPSIAITTPQNWSSFSEDAITIVGQAKRVSTIWLNDRKVYINENGDFKEKLLLPPGYTIITFRAEDRFGRTVERKLSLWRTERTKEIEFTSEETTSTSTATTTKKINN